MSRKELLITQINSLPDYVIEKVMEFVSFQRYSLGLFESDTDYLNSVTGMAESIVQGMNIHKCFEALE